MPIFATVFCTPDSVPSLTELLSDWLANELVDPDDEFKDVKRSSVGAVH